MVRDPVINAAIGRAVRSLRIERGYSQEELAARSDGHLSYIGGIERGERNPTVTVLYRLAKALDVTGSELLAAAEKHA